MVAVFIHLDDSDIENGGLAIFPGSHKLGPQENASDVSTHFYVSQVHFLIFPNYTRMLSIAQVEAIPSGLSNTCNCKERSSGNFLISIGSWKLSKYL